MTTRRRASTALGPLGVAALALAAVGCGDDTEAEPRAVTPAKVIVTAIRGVVDTELSTTTEPDASTPIVYVVSVAENGISPGAQADVASALRDDIEVRFADQRAEAIDEGGDGAPVPDGGVLLVIGEIPAEGRSIEVAIEVYRNEDDWRKAVFTFRFGGDEWSVTSSSAVPLVVS
jgi:hypothetical protein